MFLTATRETNETPIQSTLGQEQSGASGVNDPDEDQIIEGYIATPLILNSQTENKYLHQMFTADSIKIHLPHHKTQIIH
eukprot:11563282-Ditylum_brightwellii.AAC.1